MLVNSIELVGNSISSQAGRQRWRITLQNNSGFLAGQGDCEPNSSGLSSAKCIIEPLNSGTRVTWKVLAMQRRTRP